MISFLEWNDFISKISAQEENSLDFVLLISSLIPSRSLNDQRWINDVVRALRPGGLLFVQGQPEKLPTLGVYLDQLLSFKYWIAVESYPPKYYGGLPSTHAAILLFTKGKRFNIQKVRFPHQICKACGKPLRDWGGKAHLMHPDGVAISDVWKDLPPANNLDAISMPVFETILKLLPIPRDNLRGIIAPENGIKENEVMSSIHAFSSAEPATKYDPTPLQYSFGDFLVINSTEENKEHVNVDQQLWNRVIQGDILEVLRQYPNESVDLVFADPPYNLDKAYNTYEDEKDRNTYLEWCNLWLDEYIRILKPTGSLYLLNLPRWGMYHANYLNQRLVFQNWIVWDALSEPRGKIMPAHYALLYYTRNKVGFTFNYKDVSELDARYYCLRSSCIRNRKQRGENDKELLTDIWWDIHRIKHPRDRDFHPCQLPEALLERIIRLSTNPGDVVLDAFLDTFPSWGKALKAAKLEVSHDHTSP